MPKCNRRPMASDKDYWFSKCAICFIEAEHLERKVKM